MVRTWTYLSFSWVGKNARYKKLHHLLVFNSNKFTSIKQKLINENLTEKIYLVKLRLSSLPYLPPHYNTTNGLLPYLMSTLKMSGPMFAKIVSTIKTDLLLYDLLQPWAPRALIAI